MRQTPDAQRDAFEALAACVERVPPLQIDRVPLVPHPTGSPVQSLPPWRLFLALAIVSGVVARRRRVREVAGLALVCLATLVGRRLTWEPAFFRQDGLGTMWIEHALGIFPSTNYGPGCRELFGWLAPRAADPERLVFAAQGLLAATGPACAFVIARRVGARIGVAAAAALLVALDPLRARLAGSESYYAATGSLLLLAGAAVSLVPPIGRLRAPAFLLPATAAGLFVAQALRMNLVCCLAAPTVPLVFVPGRGAPRRRLRQTAAAAVVIAAVVAVAAVPSILETLRGPVAPRAVSRGVAESIPLGPLALDLLPVTAGCVLLAGLSFSSLLAAVTLAITIFAALAGNIMLVEHPWIQVAYFEMYTPALLASTLSIVLGRLRRPGRQPLAAALVGLCAISFPVVFGRALLTVPTDAAECRDALAWRHRLPPGSSLVYLQSVGLRYLKLPLYGAGGADGVNPYGVDTNFLPILPAGGETYWYRSSLCDVPEGRAFCDAVERQNRLEAIEERVLPALASNKGMEYVGPSVHVGLYRVLP